MSLLINTLRSSLLTRLGSSRSPSLFQFSRRISSQTSGTFHSTSTSIPTGDLPVGPWDSNNRIRVAGATLGIIGVVGMLFDTFYRRATKQELNLAMEKVDAKFDKLDAKIDSLSQHVDAKIDGLTNALLHTNQRDKIAAETENRELRREIERLKGNEARK